MIPYILVSAYLVLVAFTAANAHAADPPKGGVIDQYVRQAQACQKQLGQPRFPRHISPWDLKGHNPAKVLRLWQTRLAACRETRRQWDWSAWLPDKWRRIGVCETQLNWQHYNSSYEGAFGFATSSWDAFKPSGYPDHASQASPWMQYQVALAIYRRYGFSGWGCRNA